MVASRTYISHSAGKLTCVLLLDRQIPGIGNRQLIGIWVEGAIPGRLIVCGRKISGWRRLRSRKRVPSRYASISIREITNAPLHELNVPSTTIANTATENLPQ